MRYVVAWVAVAVAFFALDFVWLSQMYARLYKPLLGDLFAGKPDIPAAIAFYALYFTGLVVLVVAPALEKQSLWRAVAYGAFAGLFAYGTYDLTNQATLKLWDVRVTLADLAWGTFVSAAGSAAGYLAASLIKR